MAAEHAAWVPPPVRTIPYQVAFADEPTGVSALFDEARATAIVQSRRFDYDGQGIQSNYLYLERQEDIRRELYRIQKRLGLQAAQGGNLLSLEAQRFQQRIIGSTVHTVTVILEASQLLVPRAQPDDPIRFDLTPQAALLIEHHDLAQFHANFGYYFIDHKTRLRATCAVWHFEYSSNVDATSADIQARFNAGRQFNAATLGTEVENFRNARRNQQDLTIRVRIHGSGLGVGEELQFNPATPENQIFNEFGNAWATALTNDFRGQPYEVRLRAYRTLANYPRVGLDAGVAVVIEARLRALASKLEASREAVAQFPSPTRREHFRHVYADCNMQYTDVKEMIRPNQHTHCLNFLAAINAATDSCDALINDIRTWTTRFDYIVSLRGWQRLENQTGAYRYFVPWHHHTQLEFGSAPPTNCPSIAGSMQIGPAWSWLNYHGTLQIPFDPAVPQILLSYRLVALKTGDNGYWKTNHGRQALWPILLRDANCEFHFSHYGQRSVHVRVDYRLGRREDYNFPELL